MAQNKNPNLYEGMYIISAKLSDDARQKALEKIKAQINGLGGEIKKIHEQGRKRLAYEINDHHEGYYYLIYFELHPSAVAELQHEFHLNEDLIRFMHIRAENVMEKIEFKPIAESQ